MPELAAQALAQKGRVTVRKRSCEMRDRGPRVRRYGRRRLGALASDASGAQMCIAPVRSAMDSIWRKCRDQLLFLIPDIINLAGTRSQINVLSTTGELSSGVSIRNDIRLVPWNVYHRLVDLPTALGF